MSAIGVTLGKYAPFHRGHQFVIETALRETDHVIVLIYPASETNVPLTIRANWIRTLHPAVEVIEAWDGPTQVGDAPEITRAHDEYLVRLLGSRGITHFYSSEPYGAHVSRALGTIDRRVDLERVIVPVSATQIRSDPFEHRSFLDPVVYRDLILRVVFVGAPSTGKTTMAATMASRHATTCMPEYGREYWEQHHVERRLTIPQLVEIAEGHRQREDEAILDANRVLFVDTEAITTRLFCRYYHGESAARIDALADESASRYDVFFLCETDIPYADTSDRSGAANREMFQLWIRDELARRRIPFLSLRGTVEERVAQVTRVVDGFEKYTSLVEHLLDQASEANGIRFTPSSGSSS